MMFRGAAIALWTSLWFIDPSVSAAEYPTRSIRLIVPYPAGGTTDVMARAMQEPLAKLLGQPIVIDNKSGAAGTLGAAEVARSDPDGYTLLFSNDGPSIIGPLLQKQRPFDPIESFTPISLVSTQPLVLVVSSELPVKDSLRKKAIKAASIWDGRSGIAGTSGDHAVRKNGGHFCSPCTVSRCGTFDAGRDDW